MLGTIHVKIVALLQSKEVIWKNIWNMFIRDLVEGRTSPGGTIEKCGDAREC